MVDIVPSFAPKQLEKTILTWFHQTVRQITELRGVRNLRVCNSRLRLSAHLNSSPLQKLDQDHN